MLTCGRSAASTLIAILSCTAIAAETLKVATFNMRQEGRQNKTVTQSVWDEHHWFYRRPEIVEQIRQVYPDLLGCQELSAYQFNSLKPNLRELGYGWIAARNVRIHWSNSVISLICA